MSVIRLIYWGWMRLSVGRAQAEVARLLRDVNLCLAGVRASNESA